ncbi:MAG TPA: DUF2007 domain-containing protein [Flavobacterium sp.]|nr:DUF2007 domain-containing protein [Flavobacterium sp.]
MENHLIVFSGSEIEVIKVRLLLEQNNIAYIERNDIQSGVTAGFGTIDQAVHILVDKADYDMALEYLQPLK